MLNPPSPLPIQREKNKRLSQLGTGQPSVGDADEDHRFQVSLDIKKPLLGVGEDKRGTQRRGENRNREEGWGKGGEQRRGKKGREVRGGRRREARRELHPPPPDFHT